MRLAQKLVLYALAVALLPLGPGYGFHQGAPGAPEEDATAAADPGYGFFDNAPGAPGEGNAAATPAPLVTWRAAWVAAGLAAAVAITIGITPYSAASTGSSKAGT